MNSKVTQHQNPNVKSLKTEFNSSQFLLRIKLAQLQRENVRLKKESDTLKNMLAKLQQINSTLHQ